MSSVANQKKANALFAIFLFVGCCALFAGALDRASLRGDANLPSLIPPQNLKFFILGYNEVVADVLWIRAIQDFDYCENRPVGARDQNVFKCEHGWVYHMVDTITELTPRFFPAYYSGGLMLSVVVNDSVGASAIFDKGVAQFPDDWSMLYVASYQAITEEKDLKKASALLARAGKLGAPLWVLSLSARLREKTGELDLAKSIMENAVKTAPDENQAGYFKKRLAEIKNEIAKQSSSIGDASIAPARESEKPTR